MMNNLKDLLEDICAEIRVKKNGHIDFRTTMGRTTKSFIDKMADPNAVKDPETKVIDAAAAAKPAKELPIQKKINEEVVRRVLDGEVIKSTDAETQKKTAHKRSPYSKQERKRIAQKAADTRKKDPASIRDATKKREKSVAKRVLLDL